MEGKQEGKQTKGRQKIEMKKIENDDDKYASFSKRKNGIFKKASEMCTLCSVNIGIIIFSPTNKPFSFFHPNMETVLNRFRKIPQEPDHVDELFEANSRANIEKLNKQLDELEAQMEIEEQRAKHLDQIGAPKDMFGWLDTPIEEMNKEQVTNLEVWISDMLVQLENHANELKSGASSSTVVLPEGFNVGASSSTVLLKDFNVGASSSTILPKDFHFGTSSSAVLPKDFNFGASSSIVPPADFNVGASSLVFPSDDFNVRASSSAVLPKDSNFGASSSIVPPADFCAPPKDFNVGASSSTVLPKNFSFGASSSAVRPKDFNVGAFSSAFPSVDFNA